VVLGQSPDEQLVSDGIALDRAAKVIAPPPIVLDTTGPLDEGDLTLSDPANFIGTMIPNNLVLGLFRGKQVASVIPMILEHVDKLADPDRWRLLEDQPFADIESLRQTLLDLYAVVAEQERGDHISTVELAKARRRGLAAAAQMARHRANVRMQQVGNAVVRALGKAGYRARVVRREAQLKSHVWPSTEFLFLIEMDSMFHWEREMTNMIDICMPALSDRAGFFIAPIRMRRIVGSCGVKVDPEVISNEPVRDWPDLPMRLLDEPVTAMLRRGLDALVEASGILASIQGNEIHDEEAAALKVALDQADATRRFFHDIVEETQHPLLLELHTAFLELDQTVTREGYAQIDGEPVQRGVAASIVAGIKGDINDVFLTYYWMLAASVEYDADPEGAWGCFQDAVAT
jgi:hypothetical protein